MEQPSEPFFWPAFSLEKETEKSEDDESEFCDELEDEEEDEELEEEEHVEFSVRFLMQLNLFIQQKKDLYTSLLLSQIKF